MSDLNEEQRLAADLGASAVVSAGAGSGKTRVLTVRWLNALPLNGFRPDRLLALTFTEKAAGEMKERLRAQVESRAMVAGADPGWRRAREELWCAPVGTVHSFCASLLREFPLESGVDPDFGVLEETDRQLLAEEVAAETVDRLMDAKDSDLAVVAARWTRRYVQRRVADALTERERYEGWAQRVSGCSAAALLERWGALADRRRIDAVREILSDPAARRALMLVTGESTPPAEDSGVWKSLGERLLTRAGRPRARIPEEWAPAAAAVARQRKALSLAIGPADEDAAELLPAFARVVREAMRRYGRECETQRRMDFDALQAHAVTLLRDRPRVRKQVRARYDQVFVDEAQDTSPLQWSLVRSLVATADGSWPQAGFFAVGDDKQSIYGFRGAEPDAFRALGASVEKSGGRALRLSTSYRMRRAPLDFANLLANRLLPGPQEDLDAGRREPDGDPGAVELVVCSDDGSAAERAERLATLVVRRMVHVLDARGAAPRDAALLLRSRAHLGVWEESLWRHGVPFVTAAGVGFFQRREILDLCALLGFLHDPRDEVALATALRAPLFALSDVALFRLKSFRRGGLWAALKAGVEGGAEVLSDPRDRAAARHAVNVLARLRSLAGRLPAGRLLRFAVEATGYIGVLAAQPRGDQALANVDKLIALVRGDAGPLGPLVRRLDRLLARADRESQAALVTEGRDAVRVMTVHASKGLEFPVVAVADLAARIRSPLAVATYLGELDGTPELAPSLPRREGEPEERRRMVVRTLLGERLRGRQIEEEARLLYVACTRARDHLSLAASLPSTPSRSGFEAPIDLLRAPLSLGAERPAIDILRADDIAVTPTVGDPPEDVLATLAASRWS